uniref:Uncharacterized protein n=2 Tax=Tetradesmus obliquus TaxID=3088 RepID=A0A383WFI4_TETOB|eukprot:jgi/Sobl393_1/5942/SZX75506.1
MCASSKLLRSAWLQLLRQQPDPAWLLAAVADAAHASSLELQAKATALVHWLLNSLSEARLAEHPSIPAGLLAIPNMPRHLIKELCQLGIKVPYKEIAAAARRRVQGVEVWINVQLAMGPMDVPPAVKALYSKIEDWQHELSPAAAAAAVEAAVQAGSTGSLEVLPGSRSLAAAADLLVPALLLAVRTDKGAMLSALLEKATGHVNTPIPVVDNAARFSADGVCQVLAAAARCSNNYVFQRLWKLPAASSMQGEQLGQLLRCAAAAVPPPYGVKYAEVVDRYLRQHPAWSSVSEADKQAWRLRQAVQEGRHCRRYLTGPCPPAMDQELADCLVELAVSMRDSSNFKALVSLPACANYKLDRCRVQELLLNAVDAAVRSAVMPASDHHAGSSGLHRGEQRQQIKETNLLRGSAPTGAASSWLTALCQWDAAADGYGWCLVSCLQAAMQAAHSRGVRPPTSVMQQLCSSKAAASTRSTAELRCLLELAIAARDAACVKLLLQCPAAADLTPCHLKQLLRRAFHCCHDYLDGPSCRSDDVSNSPYVCRHSPYGMALPGLSYCAGAAHAASAFAGQLLLPGSPCKRPTLSRSSASVTLCGITSGRTLDASSDSAARAKRAATAGRCVAAGVAADQLVVLLRAAMQQQDRCKVAALCRSQAAAQLDLAAVHELLLAAADMPICLDPSVHQKPSCMKKRRRPGLSPAVAAGGSSGCGSAPASQPAGEPASRTQTDSPDTRSSKRPRLAMLAPAVEVAAPSPTETDDINPRSSKRRRLTAAIAGVAATGLQAAAATDTGTAELPEERGVSAAAAAAAAASAVPEATATTAPAGTGALDAAADTTAAAAAAAAAAPAAPSPTTVHLVGAAEESVVREQCYELLQVPGYGTVRLLPAPDSAAAAAALKQSFVYALITADSSYLLQLLQPQQAGKLALLAWLQEGDRGDLLQQQQVAQLLDEVYACSQQQQWQLKDGEEDGSDGESSVLYIATDDEECSDGGAEPHNH